VLAATPSAWNKLTDQQRAWLRTAAREAVAPSIQSMRNDSEDLGNLCRNPQFSLVTARAADIASIKAAVQPVSAWLRTDPETARYLDEIAALRNSVSPFPDEEPSCAGFRTPTAALGGRTPFDGTYRMVTPADCDPIQHSPENCGTWTFYFNRGHFAITQENGAACTWGYGTYRVTGSKIEWLFADGGGVAPTNALDKPGEDFVFAWSVYKGRTTLTAVPGGLSPDNFYLRPWRRLSAEPDPSYLSTRCPPPPQARPK